MKSYMEYWKGDLNADFFTYRDGTTAIILTDTDNGEKICTATVWIPNLSKDEIAIKDYSENDGVLTTLIEGGLIKDPPERIVPSGYVSIPVYKFTKPEIH